MYDDNFSPEQSGQTSDALPQEDARLMSELQGIYRASAERHRRSLERVRARLAQQEALKHGSHPTQWTEGKIITIKEKNVMEDKNVSWGMNASAPLSQTKKSGSMVRTLGISLVAAVAVITIISFTIFSGVLRSAPKTAGHGASTITGAPGQQQQPEQQKALSNGKLVCSVGLDIRAEPPIDYNITSVNWSAQGKIAASSIQNFTLFSAKDCSAKSTTSTTVYEKSWSPDGTKLVTASFNINALNVLDSHGNVITNIPFTQLGAIAVGPLVWSSDGNKLIFVSQESNHQSSIKSVDAANGGNIKTLMTIPSGGTAAGVPLLSPGGKYAILVQFNISTKQKDHSLWDVTTGNKISDLTSDNGKGSNTAEAFSSDGALLALAGNGKIRIYNATDGKLQSSFADSNGKQGLQDLAWSHDGRYIAGIGNDIDSNAINIYDVKAGKMVTTFGKVDAHHEIFSIAWAPDGTGLVSSADLTPDDGHSQTFVNVWALS